jgi:Mn2+/Fe2+ NRAMP family transporter
VLASVIGRARGWQPAGSFRLGRFGWAVNVAALVYGVTAIVVLPVKTPVNGTSFFDRWMVPLSVGIVAAVGVLHLLVMRPKEHVTEADRAPVSAAVAG